MKILNNLFNAEVSNAVRDFYAREMQQAMPFPETYKSTLQQQYSPMFFQSCIHGNKCPLCKEGLKKHRELEVSNIKENNEKKAIYKAKCKKWVSKIHLLTVKNKEGE
jgi:hypothetical protein